MRPSAHRCTPDVGAGLPALAGVSTLTGIAPVAVILALGATYLVTTQPGQAWGDDFAQYILHARNIVQGRDYSDTGYVYNVYRSQTGPRAYPPVFPLLLAPVYALRGPDLVAMKVLVACCLTLALGLTLILFRRELPPLWLAGVAMAAGLHPFLWAFRDNVLSDIPFLAATLGALIAAQRIKRSDSTVAHGLVLGVLVYVAYGMRTAGAALIPAVALQSAISRPRRARAVLAGAAAFGVLAFAQHVLVPGTESYADQFPRDIDGAVDVLTRNGRDLAGDLGGLWGSWIGVPLLVLAAVGYGSRLHDASAVEWFVPVYACEILLWPAQQGARLLLPFIPLVVGYAAVGIRTVHLPPGLQPVRAYAGTAILGLAAFVYLPHYGMFLADQRSFGSATDSEARSLYDYVSRETEPGAIVAFRKPRAMALFSAHGSGYCPPASEEDPASGCLRRIGAAYVVAVPEDAVLWKDIAQANPSLLAPAARVGPFDVYRVLG